MSTKTDRSTESSVVVAGQVLHFALRDDGTFPNSPFPLLVYVQVLGLSEESAASEIERLLEANGWTGSWRNGIYSYQHYHSTAHEVLLVYRGSATVQFGGPSGVSQKVTLGDAVVIPAGVAHKNLGSSYDFAVVGAYPEGQEPDMCYGRPEERPEADENIKRVPKPKIDPVYGSNGPLLDQWLRRREIEVRS